jgi:hypothetical protein
MRRLLISALILLLLGPLAAAPGQVKCSLCGSVIPDGQKFYRVEGSGEIYCERCFLEAPRCVVCKLPTAAEDIDPETGACRKCLAKLPRCKACGKPIVGAYYTYASSTGVYCPTCRKTRHACDICGVPVDDHYWQYPDGRIICSECGERAIFNIEAVRTIVRIMQETVEKRLGLKLKRPYTLSVEMLSGLAPEDTGAPRKAESAKAALYGKELGLYRTEGNRSEIVLLFGLPPDLLYEAAAHEYAHAWQAENGYLDLTPEMVEGFAQWVAAEVLRAQGFRGTLEKLEARTDYPYGTGYQKLKELNQKVILELLQKKR